MEEHEVIFISQILFDEWGLSTSMPIQIKAGHLKQEASVLPLEGDHKEILLSQRLFNELAIPYPSSVHAIFNKGCLYLGPFIGIAMIKMSSIIIHVLKDKLSSHPGFHFAFTPSDINWSNLIVTGTFLTKDTDNNFKFEKYDVPFPDVIFNQIRLRRAYRTKKYTQFFTDLKQNTQSRLINPRFLNKSEIHSILSTDADLINYLPETCISPSLTQTRKLIKRSSAAFFKPIIGSKGLGIYKVSYNHKTRRYLCQSRFRGKEINHEYRKLKVLIKKHIKLPKYLIQQEIILPRYNNDFFDFRVHINKDGKNKWVVSAIGANVNNPNKVTTHGGWIKSGSQILQFVFKDRADELEKGICCLAIKIGQVLDKNFNGIFGDLGIDLCIDNSGKPWIFEVNCFPGRHIFKHRLLQS